MILVNDTVLSLIKGNNNITATEISKHLKISLSTTKRKIKELKTQGKIERIGSDKTGLPDTTDLLPLRCFSMPVQV